MCGHDVILVFGYHLFFTVGPRIAPRAVSVGLMVAIVNICLCHYFSAAVAAYVIHHPGSGQWGY